MQLIHKLTFVPRFVRQFFYTYFNRLIFKSAGVEYGVNLRVYSRFYLKKYLQAKVSIGDNFVITSGEGINPICRNIRGCVFVNKNAKLSIGNNVGMSSPCIWCDKLITIGDNVKLGGLVTILDTDCHSLNYVCRQSAKEDANDTIASPVVIENDVLIGANSIILKGVTIGARSIIGAGSVVSSDIPSDCIAVGNPCRVVRFNK